MLNLTRLWMVCFFTLPVFAVQAADDEMLAVEVGDPVLVAKHTGAETIANMPGYYFCGLIREGNGNLIGLYELRADWCMPEEYDLRE